MTRRPPVLVVDAGNTLITRTRPGLTARVVQALLDVQDGIVRSDSEIRVAVLTSAELESCLSALDLGSSARSAVATTLAEDHGEAIVLPGAEHLLRTATDLGWKVIVATNAGPRTPDLPDELTRYLSGVVESRTCGFVKEDPRFWRQLVEDAQLDPLMTVVVGDCEAADRLAPSIVGLQSRLIATGGPDLGALARDLEAAGTAPAQSFAVVAGDHEQWAGQDIVAAPHLDPLVTRVTRARVKFSTATTAGTAVIVRRRSKSPAVVGHVGALLGMVWLLRGRQRQPFTMPTNLRAALETKRLSLDVLPPPDRKHALSMIREAKTDATRAQRIADLVSFLEKRAQGDLT